MKIISHRGNLNGRISQLENYPTYINWAIENGFDVEIDLRMSDGKLYLGHDTPDNRVDLQWLINRNKSLWVHCKDLESVAYCEKLRVFCHTQDPFCIVYPKHIWVHDLSLKLNKNCIIPLLSKEDIDNFDFTRVDDLGGICTDFPKYLKEKYE